MDEVLKKRSITGIIFGIVVISLLMSGKSGTALLLGIVAAMGTYEYHTMCKKPLPVTWIATMIAIIIIVIAYITPMPMTIKDSILGLSIFFYSFFLSNVLTDVRISHHKVLPFIALIYPIAAMALPLLYTDESMWNNHFWLWAMVMIWISDTGAYLVGRKWGKTKLIERVSPKKTIEGSLGAGLFTVAGGIIIGYFNTQYPMLFWVLLALTIWIIGTFGDLFESTIKRKYDIKDSGNTLPGHGGFLDRFDSFIFVAPFLVLIIKFYNSLI